MAHNQWKVIFKHEAQASVNSIAFAPWEYGLVLACGVADGKVLMISQPDGINWEIDSFDAHDGGVNGISWGPPSSPCILAAENNNYMEAQANEKSYQLVPKRFVTGGMDGKAKIWQQNINTK